LVFSYEILTPAALNFFVSYAEGAVESLWSIDQYFQFVLVLMLSTGLSFQVCIAVSRCQYVADEIPTQYRMCGLWSLSLPAQSSSKCPASLQPQVARLAAVAIHHVCIYKPLCFLCV
jgi:hypothetical protein